MDILVNLVFSAMILFIVSGCSISLLVNDEGEPIGGMLSSIAAIISGLIFIVSAFAIPILSLIIIWR